MLISEGYRKEQELLHLNLRYGAASMKFASRINELVADHRPRSILDYGAGKRLLRKALHKCNAELVEYDPGVPDISEPPQGVFDMVFCIDVLEHVEPEFLGAVLSDIRARAGGHAFLTIHTGPAGKTLRDGRNAHLIQRPIEWWLERIGPLFWSIEHEQVGRFTYAIVCEVQKCAST